MTDAQSNKQALKYGDLQRFIEVIVLPTSVVSKCEKRKLKAQETGGNFKYFSQSRVTAVTNCTMM